MGSAALKQQALAQRALAESTENQRILRAVARHANDGLVYMDMRGRTIWANPAYCRTMGYELAEIVGRNPMEFCFPDRLRPSDDVIAGFRFDPSDETFESFHRHLNVRKNGEEFWNEFSQAVVEPEPGEQRVVLVSRDITHQVRREEELETARAELHKAAFRDALTGLHNRTAFLNAIEQYTGDTNSSGSDVVLLYIDLDHFKAINDSHGHSAGDKVLNHVADAIRATLRSNDLACRMGGDEFVMACVGCSDFDVLQLIADNLLERINRPVNHGDTAIKTSASVGIALSMGRKMLAEDLVKSADFALYEAKVPGAPRIARYDAELHARREAETALIEEFIDVLDTKAISFEYQPILDGRTGRIRSFEALARWHRENGETIMPDRFLPLASRLGRMVDVDFAAIRATCELVADLSKRGHHIRGAFNTSSDALAHPEFLRKLDLEARDAGLEGSELVAEEFETTFFGADTTNSVAAARIRELREHGYAVFLDDFGVGYAGLAHLSQLDISGIKLDRSLIANVTHDQSAQIITTSILKLCDELNVGTLAEGIETREQADFLLEHGCYRLQGFGIAKPLQIAVWS